jgi:hypothetical protein
MIPHGDCHSFDQKIIDQILDPALRFALIPGPIERSFHLSHFYIGIKVEAGRITKTLGQPARDSQPLFAQEMSSATSTDPMEEAGPILFSIFL